MTSSVKDAARSAESSPVVRALARGGFVANGVVHLLLGVIVLAVAFGGSGETSQSGAFKAIAAAPLGFVVLWVLAILLWALGIWHVLEGISASRGSDVKNWGVRISEWGQALVFFALGVIAAAVALGARTSGDQAAQSASGDLLKVPGGVFVLGLAGVGVGIGGISFIVMAVKRSFRKKMSIPSGRVGTTATILGIVGYLAEGVALVIVGILLIVAAVQVDPAVAGGFDAAIKSLLSLFLGPLLVGAVGVGFLAYGVFLFFRAKYARLS